MSHSYSSDFQRHQPGTICLDSSLFGVGPPPDQAPHRGLVRRFLRGALSPEKRVPVADAACGLPGLAHLLQVFPAMERATRPGEVFHSGAGLKKIGWRGPVPVKTGEWSERTDQLLCRGLPERQEHRQRREQGL